MSQIQQSVSQQQQHKKPANFKGQHTQRCEAWRLLTAQQRAEHLSIACQELSELAADSAKAKRLFDHLLAQAEKLDMVTELEGATGESNALYVTARGKTMIVGIASAEVLPVIGQLIAALLAGNEVILHYPSHDELCEKVCRLLRQAGVFEDVISVANDSQLEVLLHMGRLATVGVVASEQELAALAATIASTDGILTQVVAVTDMAGCQEMLLPDFILRYSTERVMTINTTAIGGNAKLIELGMG
ncbi:1-pyrroline-5-carboxylate dehydrogenase [Psychrobacter sp. I-STPA10]|uniref:1-pyrroline-5-carboxylate dehydrogenase n=1 Tax=Psychrobacter sp. I-STPA10 TaxID=2585769 RepID=UPI001E3146C7|nr:1-pyrroline-5-carboxylate dehydrogenase [Psychrobacter sp. I-STPA10]